MKIQINDRVGLNVHDTLKLVRSLIDNRPPTEERNFDYGFETHGIFGITLMKLPYPIQVRQTNKRKSNSSPIVISIEKHTPIF